MDLRAIRQQIRTTMLCPLAAAALMAEFARDAGGKVPPPAPVERQTKAARRRRGF